MKNQEVARLLYAIADLLEMQGTAFKPRAYENAAREIETFSEDIEAIWKQDKLKELPGIGESIAKKIDEFLRTGKSRYYDNLRKSIPIKVDELMRVPGLGPKRLMLLHKELGIKDLATLKKAAEQHKIQVLTTFGEKSEEEILRGIAVASAREKRFLWGYLAPIAEQIKAQLAALPSVKQIEIAGSYRRRKETVGDIDILVTSPKPTHVMDAFTTLPDVAEVLAHGAKKSTVRLKSGLQVDVRVLKEEEYGSALQYFTGSKEHNVTLRKLALSKGYTLSEYGLFTLKGKKLVAGRTEKEIYDKLGVQWMPPEMRENTGEIELGQEHHLPNIITNSNVHGDFQTQTDWSDGAHSIEEMARTGKSLGWTFIAITDHAGPLAIAHALDEKRLQKQAKEIDKAAKKAGITLFKGAEVDILKNGRLAISRKAQEQLDVVLASVHSSFKMPEKEMTSRICRALENGRVHVFAHPTGRLIFQREPYAVNMEKLFDTAKRTNTFLEINGYPERTDLNDANIRAAKAAGCRFVLSSDAHNRNHLHFVQYATAQARRGWCEAKDILNTYPLAKIQHIFESK